MSQWPQVSVLNDVVECIVSGAVSSVLSELQSRRNGSQGHEAQPEPQAHLRHNDRPHDDRRDDDENDFKPAVRKRYIHYAEKLYSTTDASNLSPIAIPLKALLYT